MVRRLHHIAIGALDVEHVAQFYREVFSLPELARHHDETAGTLRSIWLGVDDTILMIERATTQRGRVDGVGAGPFITVFRSTKDERTLLEERISSSGGRIEERTAFTSYTRDPEGNRVGFSTWPEPSSSTSVP
jgi:catechol 2,3-dioxygenase-like lactoylglutathione lyase family enzyme